MAYTIIAMNQFYPFGELRELNNEGDEPVVAKRLAYHSPEERQIIEKMVELMDSLHHDSLIKIIKA